MSLTIKQASLLQMAQIPMFFVSDGLVLAANAIAETYGVTEGQPVMSLLWNCVEEYEAFSKGKLYCKLKINGTRHNAAISCFDGIQVFVIDTSPLNTNTESDISYIQKMRSPISKLLNFFGNLQDEETEADKFQSEKTSILQILRILEHITLADTSAEKQPTPTIYGNIVEHIDKLVSAVQNSSRAISIVYDGLQDDIFCKFSPRDLEVALYNLLANANKYGAANSICVSLKYNGNKLYIAVENKAKTNATSAVDLYACLAENPNANTYNLGIGHGIQVVRNITHKYGGTLHMQLTDDPSVIFTISLPTDGFGSQMLCSPIDSSVDVNGGISVMDIEFSDQ